MEVLNSQPLTVVGHPFSSTGMGEQMRSGVRALDAVSIPLTIVDLFKYSERVDPSHRTLVDGRELPLLGTGGIRIFHMNGNEVGPALTHLKALNCDFAGGYNIIMPAWELPRYPKVWVQELRRFDEVWAISKYVHQIYLDAGLNSHWIGQSVEIPPSAFLPRAFFGIRESAFVLLHFFDSTSFAARKNPYAAIELYRRIRQARPFEDVQLVLKVKHGDSADEEWCMRLREAAPDALLLDRRLDTFELHSLIACSDCLVSLHRAEGFGRGTGEAMFLGRLAMATNWSGNLEYMRKNNSLAVDYTLVPVKNGEYPHWRNQMWAEPNLDHAFSLLSRVLDEPQWADKIRRSGRRGVMETAGHRPVGLRALARLRSIWGNQKIN